jgi:membrane protein
MPSSVALPQHRALTHAEPRTKSVWALLPLSVSEWRSSNAPQDAAALAYYTILSIAPLVLIAISVAGLVFGRSATEEVVVREFESLVGRGGAETLRSMIDSASKPSRSIVGTIVGVGVLIAGASGVFAQLQASLNHIWEVRPKPHGGIWRLLRKRFLSFGMVLAIGFLLLVSLLAGAALAALGNFATRLLPGGAWLWQGLHAIVAFAFVTVAFALMFRFLPDAKVRWRDVWIGALATALLFTLGKFAIGVYLGRSAVISSNGAAGSVVGILVWIYYAAQLVFFGAAFTRAQAKLFGVPISPSENAEKVPPVGEAQPARS